MSTTVSLSSRRSPSHRTQVLASVSALVAAASVAVTLAVAGGAGDTAPNRPAAAPATATPNPATLYRNDVAAGRAPGQLNGPSAAERFHHFR